MSHSQNSMGYMVVLCIILYIVGVSIYLFVKFVRKKLDEGERPQIPEGTSGKSDEQK